jgi:hypothetical protein
VTKVPKGVQGESLGAGPKRAKAGSKSCAIVALALTGGATAGVAVIIGLMDEARRVVFG